LGTGDKGDPKIKSYKIAVIGSVLFALGGSVGLVARDRQDRDNLKALNGVAFEGFKG
jgi:hypothetical protein